MRLALAEEEGDLGLQGVGVLELVDQQVAEASLQGAPRGEVAVRQVALQQVAQTAQQVGEVEEAERQLRVARPARERVGDRDGEAVRNCA